MRSSEMFYLFLTATDSAKYFVLGEGEKAYYRIPGVLKNTALGNTEKILLWLINWLFPTFPIKMKKACMNHISAY